MKRPIKHLFTVIVFLAGLVGSSGCDSSGTEVGRGLSRVLGRALAPESDGGDKTQVPLSNADVILIEIDENGDLVSAQRGTTDANGNFIVDDVQAQTVIAIEVQGMTNDGAANISGLYNPTEPMVEKDLDEATSIACVAGISAVVDGSIADDELDEMRVQILEDAAEDYLEANADFDFYDPDDREAAVAAVRSATNDGANP